MNIKNWLISFVLSWVYLVPLYSIDNPNLALAERLWTLGEFYMLEHPEEFFSDQICVHNATTHGEPQNIDLTTLMQWEESRIQALPGVWEPQEIAAFDDKVVAYCKCSGVQCGDIFEIQSSGKPFTIYGLIILRFESGKICEIWSCLDRMSLVEQLK